MAGTALEREPVELPDGTRRLLLDYKTAAWVMSISEKEMKRIVAAWRVQVVRIGRLVRIPLVELEALIEREKRYYTRWVSPQAVALVRRRPAEGETLPGRLTPIRRGRGRPRKEG